MMMKNIFIKRGLVFGMLAYLPIHAQMNSGNEAAQALAQLQTLQKKMIKEQKAAPVNTTKTQRIRNAQSALPPSQQKKEQLVSLQQKGSFIASMMPKKDKETNEDAYIERKAFNEVKEKLFPLSSDQIVDLHKKFNENDLAKNTTPGTPPRPTATSQIVNLAPGSTPPVIRLAQGFVSSIVFLDATDSPWPIASYDLGDPESFNIQWDKKSNTLMIQSTKLYTYGNIAVRLEGLNTPVMLTLIPGQKAVDYRVDMRMQSLGPNAKNIPTEINLPPQASDTLLSILNAVPPVSSTLLTVKGGPAKAWKVGDKIFVRTRLTILSPGWISMMSSADGMHAYKMQQTPVLLVSWHGKLMQLKLEGL